MGPNHHPLRCKPGARAFTLIELLTVIAIIAVLAAILFPLAGTVREQARASDCMTKLHQLWVSANVYKADEGGFPPVMLGYAEMEIGGVRMPWDGNASHPVIRADSIYNGYLYGEQVKNIELFRCPDSRVTSKVQPTVAYYPVVQNTNPGQPYYWDTATYGWIATYLQAKGCRYDSALNAVEDCYTEADGIDNTSPLYLTPKYFYAYDSYDIGPVVAASGVQATDANGQPAYFRHYSTDWTGPAYAGKGTGATDLPSQLKYSNPPDDKTLLTYCTWHQLMQKTGTVTAVSMSGTAKKLNYNLALDRGPDVFR